MNTSNCEGKIVYTYIHCMKRANITGVMDMMDMAVITALIV